MGAYDNYPRAIANVKSYLMIEHFLHEEFPESSRFILNIPKIDIAELSICNEKEFIKLVLYHCVRRVEDSVEGFYRLMRYPLEDAIKIINSYNTNTYNENWKEDFKNLVNAITEDSNKHAANSKNRNK